MRPFWEELDISLVCVDGRYIFKLFNMSIKVPQTYKRTFPMGNGGSPHPGASATRSTVVGVPVHLHLAASQPPQSASGRRAGRTWLGAPGWGGLPSSDKGQVTSVI